MSTKWSTYSLVVAWLVPRETAAVWAHFVRAPYKHAAVSSLILLEAVQRVRDNPGNKGHVYSASSAVGTMRFAKCVCVQKQIMSENETQTKTTTTNANHR